MKYIFNEINVEKPFYIFFLCGAEYNKTTPEKDKRIILKNYLSSNSKIFPIILEENFIFKSTTKQYLSYDDIYMKSLLDIEILMCFFSDFIIIIHETMSTAGEIGVFGSNPKLSDKILLLVPDKYQVEEEKISGFLKYAFKNRITYLNQEDFYPVSKINYISAELKNYHTFFVNNKIGSNLSKKIDNYVNRCLRTTNIELRIDNTKISRIENTNKIMYYINKKEKIIKLFLISSDILLYIISFFSNQKIVDEMRELNTLKELVLFIKDLFIDTISNTICEKEKIIKKEYNISVLVPFRPNVEFISVIGYSLYLFQAMELLILPHDNENITIKREMNELAKKYSAIIKEYNGINIKSIIGGYDEW